MKNILMPFFIFLLVFSAYNSAHSKEYLKSSWYIGFGIGTGDGSAENEYGVRDEISNAFGSGWDYYPILIFNFGVGGIINPYLHVGFELNGLYEQAEYTQTDATADIEIYNYLGVITYFPYGKGFFIKGGAGISVWDWEARGGGQSVGDTYSGIGILFGIGYGFWLGETFNLLLHVDYSYQEYGDFIDNSDYYAIAVSFYWF